MPSGDQASMGCFISIAAFVQAARDVSEDNLQQTKVQMNSIIKEKSHMIKHIVEGFFPFDDQ